MDNTAVAKTPVGARDEFVQYLGDTLPPDELLKTLAAADKLLEIVKTPYMLNAFVLVNAELAVWHHEGLLATNLVLPKR